MMNSEAYLLALPVIGFGGVALAAFLYLRVIDAQSKKRQAKKNQESFWRNDGSETKTQEVDPTREPSLQQYPDLLKEIVERGMMVKKVTTTQTLVLSGGVQMKPSDMAEGSLGRLSKSS